MGSRGAEIDDQATVQSTPEDVTALYSWANLQGARYRDYSASRREYRAQVRYEAAKALLERELRLQAEADAFAGEAERAALAEATSPSWNSVDDRIFRLESLRIADAAARKAAAERVEAARKAEAAAHATVRALREEREIAEAHAAARRQALAQLEADRSAAELEAVTKEPAELPFVPWGLAQDEAQLDLGFSGMILGRALDRAASGELARTGTGSDSAEPEPSGPAWIYAAQTPPRTRSPQATAPVHAGDAAAGRRDTLQDSQERVAARWPALKGVFEHAGRELPAMQFTQPEPARTPLLVVFSLAGGVGKTSLVATLARACSRKGENVVVTDTTPDGLLPLYFGASELRSGVVQSFPPPGESIGEPISLAIYDTAGIIAEERAQEMLVEEILRNGQGSHRLLLDLSSGSSWMLRRMANLHPLVLVPMAPDMNSVIRLRALERLFRSITDSAGRPMLPFYLLNHFDATLPLHLDVREVLRRQLGDRLLAFAIRRSPAVSEALAEGMSVLDYQPAALVAQDYLDVASWLTSISPPATAELRSVRWSER